MYKATTPLLKFELPFEANTIAAGYITMAQKGRNIIDKPRSEWICNGRKVSVRLTQKETMQLQPNTNVEIQMRIRLADGTVLASRIFTEPVERVLKDGEI